MPGNDGVRIHDTPLPSVACCRYRKAHRWLGWDEAQPAEGTGSKIFNPGEPDGMMQTALKLWTLSLCEKSRQHGTGAGTGERCSHLFHLFLHLSNQPSKQHAWSCSMQAA